MTRTQLLAVLIAIRDEPFNQGRDIVAVAEAARSDDELAEYVLAQFRRLPDAESKQRILEIARLIAD